MEQRLAKQSAGAEDGDSHIRFLYLGALENEHSTRGFQDWSDHLHRTKYLPLRGPFRRRVRSIRNGFNWPLGVPSQAAAGQLLIYCCYFFRNSRPLILVSYLLA